MADENDRQPDKNPKPATENTNEEIKGKQVQTTPAAKPEKPEDKSAESAQPEPRPEAGKTETADKPAEAKTKDKPKAEVPAKFKKLVEEIEQLSALELSELVKTLEDRFGVSASAPMAMAPAAAGVGTEEAAAEEGKAEFNIILKETGDKKIDVIKAVREISGLGLAESKAIADSAPKTVKENVPKDEAEAGKKKLEDAGATVELE